MSILYWTRTKTASKHIWSFSCAVSLSFGLFLQRNRSLSTLNCLIFPLNASCLCRDRTLKSHTDSDSFKEWQMQVVGLSFWQAILLEWATSTGEMRNPEACYCHTDGNKSHFMETMWLGGKVDLKDQSSSTTKVKGMTNGKLVLPVQGVIFDVRCGSDLLHLCLKNTMHAADETRDRLNFTRVHGP